MIQESAGHQQNANDSERNYELAGIPFAQNDNSSEPSVQALDMEPVLIERRSPRIGRVNLDLHAERSNGMDFDIWTGMATIDGQEFRLLFDTTSSGLWVPSMDSVVTGKRKFRPTLAADLEQEPYRTAIPKHRLIPGENVHKANAVTVVIGCKSAPKSIIWTVKNFDPAFEKLPFDGCVLLRRDGKCYCN